LFTLGVVDYMGLIMNIFWPGYMAAGTIYALSTFFSEQKEMVANREMSSQAAEGWGSLIRDAFAWNELLKPTLDRILRKIK